ncbi:protein MON2 homolog [Elysia marginata]|uniref:Protein MON2 homolog n=1 Tax=Elysia marginata TaxID=1093978 RepID=A0AAV4G0T5_9GAST|nr:protein MON2 homolog [Elysia marginata]
MHRTEAQELTMDASVLFKDMKLQAINRHVKFICGKFRDIAAAAWPQVCLPIPNHLVAGGRVSVHRTGAGPACGPSTTGCPPTLSVEDFQRDEALDCRLIRLIREDILPHAAHLPPEFMVSVMSLLNKGSIHSTTSDSFVDTESSRKLREEFARTCFETLLQFSFVSSSPSSSSLASGEAGSLPEGAGAMSEQGQLTRLAVLSLLSRCREVLTRYSEDERLSGKCPLPRPRLAEMSSVLKAITTLLQSLKKAPQENVEVNVWDQVIRLYPALVECTTSPSPQVSKSLRDALHEFRDLLAPPSSCPQSGTSSLSNGS